MLSLPGQRKSSPAAAPVTQRCSGLTTAHDPKSPVSSWLIFGTRRQLFEVRVLCGACVWKLQSMGVNVKPDRRSSVR